MARQYPILKIMEIGYWCFSSTDVSQHAYHWVAMRDLHLIFVSDGSLGVNVAVVGRHWERDVGLCIPRIQSPDRLILLAPLAVKLRPVGWRTKHYLCKMSSLFGYIFSLFSVVSFP